MERLLIYLGLVNRADEGYRKFNEADQYTGDSSREEFVKDPRTMAPWIMFLLFALNMVFFLFNYSQLQALSSCGTAGNVIGAATLYSPVNNVVRNEVRVFSHALSRSKFHGPPTNETDEAWEALYEGGISSIHVSQAVLLPNWTEAIPGNESYYAVALDVFHQLHCLNLIRKALLPERYGPPDNVITVPGENSVQFDHVDHCINSVRESLMCNADVAVNVWQWDDKKKRTKPRVDVLHTCKNWGDILDWATEHTMISGLDTSLHVDHVH
ncbi:hypothetical protein SISSUDRAFT_1064338 [Sistotremastrum suecicum HHB10207 ss-3]|uniref:Uncharacterized protein n=1 Tax=Sistotremastrum suecicum HHB10207 ss-3 TaxID=1314776 RepID=A0A166ARA3_9AGAM|nr:hypothetical protein SISSUDRAFT_1064338 [Sistotremastrum suecicum HHB10207 ss-3]